MAVVVLLVVSVGSDQAQAQRRNRNHWTTDADIGRGEGPVDDQALRDAPANPAEWLHYGGNYASWRHSPIERLTPDSVGDLKLAWMAQTGIPGQLEASPVVYDGILYLTSARNRLMALDAKTGELYWRYDHPNPDDLRICCGPANRGVAIAGDVVLMRGDLRGIVDAAALSRRTRKTILGNFVWAYGYNLALIPVAAGVLFPFTGYLLNPMLAAGAMSLSSVFVVTNSLRLGRFKSDSGSSVESSISESGAAQASVS